jgi:hypothetical protein
VPLHSDVFGRPEVINVNASESPMLLAAAKLCNPSIPVSQQLAKNMKVLLVGFSIDQKSFYLGLSYPRAGKGDHKKQDDDPNVYEFVRCDSGEISQLEVKPVLDKTVDSYFKYLKSPLSQLTLAEELRGSDAGNEKATTSNETSNVKPGAKEVPSKKKVAENPEAVTESESAVVHLTICSSNELYFPAVQAAIKRLLPGLESVSQDFSIARLKLGYYIFCDRMRVKIEKNKVGAEAGAAANDKKKEASSEVEVTESIANSCSYVFESPIIGAQSKISQMIEKRSFKNWSGVAAEAISSEELYMCMQAPLYLFRGNGARLYEESLPSHLGKLT